MLQAALHNTALQPEGKGLQARRLGAALSAIVYDSKKISSILCADVGLQEQDLHAQRA